MSTQRLLRALASKPERVTRAYSTGTPRPSSASQAHPYLSQLDSASTSGSASSSPHVGPFPLPNTPSDRDRLIQQQARQWSQLRPGEKIGVAAQQTSSFFVVVAGAGLCTLVVWAVSSELFGDNSPTKIFEDAVERVKADHELNTMLVPPLTFYGSPTSAASPRLRRNRRIAHSHSTDPTTGLETLFIRFYVQAAEDPVEKRRRLDAGQGTTWENALDWLKTWVGPLVWQDSHHPDNYHPHLSSDERARQFDEEERRRIERERLERSNETWAGWAWNGVTGSIGSAFGGITKGMREPAHHQADGDASVRRGGGLFKRARKPRLGEFTDGEVVAELQKDPESKQFVYKQLFVAIPDTTTPNYYRHDIPTDVVEPGTEQKGLDRLRIWQRSRTVVA
ncbi:hypothetical protein JCM10212_004587 [Sporobolomyces blumeae]